LETVDKWGNSERNIFLYKEKRSRHFFILFKFYKSPHKVDSWKVDLDLGGIKGVFESKEKWWIRRKKVKRVVFFNEGKYLFRLCNNIVSFRVF
jgi:hypothetical protein